MFNKFPREFANPKRRLVYSEEEFYELIRKFLPFTNIYTSVYSFKIIDKEKSKPNYDSAEVDKIFIDVDEPSEWEKIKYYHQLLKEQNILHTIVFSGKGFHIYIFAKLSNDNVQGWIKKEAIRNFVFKYFNDLKYDRVVIGDLARITRVPNTFNFKRKRWCVPLTSKQLSMSYDEVSEFAKSQNYEWEFFGKKRIVLDVKDVERGIRRFSEVDENNLRKIILTEPVLPPFLRKIVERKKLYWNRETGWKERFFLILWLKEIGFTFNECLAYLKNVLTPAEFAHCVYEEKQPQYIYQKEFTNDPYHFPNLEVLRQYFDISKEDEEFFQKYKLYLDEEDLVKIGENI